MCVCAELGVGESRLRAGATADAGLHFLHVAFGRCSQRAVYEYEGSVNKFLHDDKGSTLVAAWGLPPTTHADDPCRACCAALRLAQLLAAEGLVASVGVTVGDVFCGITGSVQRREYTVLGDSVNLAARLMQKAGEEACGGALVGRATRGRDG